jgi:hypothetical protein
VVLEEGRRLGEPRGTAGVEAVAGPVVAAVVRPPPDPQVLGALEGVEQVEGAAADVRGVVEVAGRDERRDLRALRPLG